MDDVDILARKHFAEVLVALDIRAGLTEAVLEMLLVHVANRQQFGGWINRLEMTHAHTPDSDDRFGERFIGRRLPRSTEHMTRHNAKRS